MLRFGVADTSPARGIPKGLDLMTSGFQGVLLFFILYYAGNSIYHMANGHDQGYVVIASWAFWDSAGC